MTSIYPKINQMEIPTGKMDVTFTTKTMDVQEKDVKSQEKEIKEVLELIDKAIVHLDNAVVKISSASEWGLFDTVCGGGCISSMVKQDNMDQANREMKLANKCVEKIKEEIKDVKDIETIHVSELLSFMDIFFDNIFSDIMVQHKIAEAERNCKKARRQLDSLRKELKERLDPNAIKKMEAEKNIKKDQEEDIKVAFETANNAIENLKKNVRNIQKAIEYTSDDACVFCFGCLGYMFTESKISDVKLKLRGSVNILEELSKKLKYVSIDTSDRSEYLKFIEMSKDILACNNTTFDKYACNSFRDLKASCLKSISEIESIRNDLKDILVKRNIQF